LEGEKMKCLQCRILFQNCTNIGSKVEGMSFGKIIPNFTFYFQKVVLFSL
jgi:hypothetical protein